MIVPAPKVVTGVPGRTRVVVRHSFEAETIPADEVNHNQTGCGRSRNVAGSSGLVAKAFGTCRRADADRWPVGGHDRSADGESRAPPVSGLMTARLTDSSVR